MKIFVPERVLAEPSALEYKLGRELYERFVKDGIEVLKAPLRDINSFIPGRTEKERYARSKKTLVLTTKKTFNFDVCKPSADFEFSLVTNCPGHCEYCYLQHSQATKPYLRLYVNIDEILNAVPKHIEKNNGNNTTFEIASSGDPLAFEHLTGGLEKAIKYFSKLENGWLRIVTKYDNVDSLTSINHNGKTKFRFSVNCRYVIDNFEHNTASFDERIRAAAKISSAGYPLGFIVAPIMLFDNWKNQYDELFYELSQKIDFIKNPDPVSFELIQHRFTPTSKKYILERYPNTKLDLDESKRMLKWGKFGRYKYVYPKESSLEIKQYITDTINKYFHNSVIEYFT